MTSETTNESAQSTGASEKAPLWNSLEIAKLIVGIITPLTLLAVGTWINSRLKDIEQLQWANQRVIEERIRVFNDYCDPLNDLYCYMTYVGKWKEMTPTDALDLKRKLDKIAYVNAPLFPAEFIDRHNELMDLCYETHGGWGTDAKLRTKFQRRKDAADKTWEGKTWQANWNNTYFSNKPVPEVTEILAAYGQYQAYIASNLGVGLRNAPNVPTKVPGNAK